MSNTHAAIAADLALAAAAGLVVEAANAAPVVLEIDGKTVTVAAGSFAIADVTSPSHLSRAGRVYAVATNLDDLLALLDDLRRSTKVWLQIVTL